MWDCYSDAPFRFPSAPATVTRVDVSCACISKKPAIMIRLIQQLLAALTPAKPEAKRTLQYWAGTVAVVAALASLIISYNIPAWRAFILCIWAIVPPMYFWFEYYCLYAPNDSLDKFKYGQEVSRNIWAGVLAALIALKITGEVQQPKEAHTRPPEPSAQRDKATPAQLPTAIPPLVRPTALANPPPLPPPTFPAAAPSPTVKP